MSAWDVLRAGKRYSPGMNGWVVRAIRTYRRASDDKKVEHIAWWYGPHHGLGTTAGRLDSSVRVWPKKQNAELALRSIFGTHARRRGYVPVRVAVAEATEQEKREQADKG